MIGKTGRNWPIRDGKDQVKLIQSSVVAAAKPAAPSAAPYQKEGEVLRRSRENSTNVTRDPHSSLALFAPRESDEEPEQLPTVIAPRASARPPPRDYHDLFVGQDSTGNADARVNDNGSESPFKHSAVGAIAPKFGAGKNYKPSRIFDHDDNDESADASARDSRSESHRHSAIGAIAPKIGAGKNYHPSRIFETDEDTSTKQSTGHKSTISLTKPNPKKYNHFDIGSGIASGDTAAAAKTNEPKSKHGSSWGFEDFYTPVKSVPTRGLATQAQDAVHWGNDNDEAPDSPIRKPKLDLPRKDAETHFEFQDDGAPEGQTRLIGRPRGAGSNNGLGLYKHNLYSEDGVTPEKVDNKREVGNLANVKDRRKDFDPHFTMTDEMNSPAGQRPLGNIANVKDRHKDFDPHFTMTDDSPAPKNSAANQKENIPITAASPIRSKPGQLSDNITPLGSRGGNEKQKGIVIGGDGMGGKKGAGRSWGFGDDSDGEQDGGVNGAGTAFSKGVGAKKAGSAAQTGGGDFWDF